MKLFVALPLICVACGSTTASTLPEAGVAPPVEYQNVKQELRRAPTNAELISSIDKALDALQTLRQAIDAPPQLNRNP